MSRFDETDVQSPPSKLENEQLRARLEFGIWRESFERAHATWTLANNDLKPALLLRGQDLADAESWLLSAGKSFTKSERQFIYKSVSHSSIRRNQVKEERNDDITESKTRTRHFILAMVVVILAVIGPGLVQFVILGPAGERVAKLLLPQSGPKPEVVAVRPQAPIVAPSPAPKTQSQPRPATTTKRGADPIPEPTPAERERQLTTLTQRLVQKGDARGALLMAIEAADAGRKVSAATPAAGDTAAARSTFSSAIVGPILSQALVTRQKLIARREFKQTGTGPLFCAGGRVVMAVVDGETVQGWDVSNGRERLTLANRTERLQAVGIDRDCGRIALAAGEYGIGIWSLASGHPAQALKGHESDVVTTRFSPDGRLLASGDQDRFARVWDLKSGRALSVLRGHEDGITNVDFSPDGGRVVTASKDKSARVWDAASGRTLMSLEGHKGIVTGVAFSADGKRILTSSWDGTAVLWDAGTGRIIARLQVERSAIMSAQFSPDGKQVATITQSNEAYVWNGMTGERVAALSGHSEPIRALSFSSDGRRLATLSWSGSVLLWDAETWAQSSVLDAGEDRPQAIAFQENGARLHALTANGTLVSWPVLASPDELLEEARKAAPACFSANERAVHGLPPELPAWCARLGKLPLEKSAMIDPR